MVERTIAGITLEQYAAVYAGTAEGFPLEVVVDGMGLDLDAWAVIDEAWSDAMAAELEAGGSLATELDAALSELRIAYARPIPPFDSDLGAWLRFVKKWSRAEDAVALLATVGLGPNDMARLHGLWSQRLAEDAVLRGQALTLLQDEGEPPRPSPEPLELRLAVSAPVAALPRHESKAGSVLPPLRAAMPEPEAFDDALPARRLFPTEDEALETVFDGELPGGAGETTLVPKGPLVDPFAALVSEIEAPDVDTLVPEDPAAAKDLNLMQYAALCAELEVMPEQAESIFAKYGLASSGLRSHVDEVWRERLETRTNTFAEWRHLYQHFRAHWLTMKSRS
jgi:hypothetical protein